MEWKGKVSGSNRGHLCRHAQPTPGILACLGYLVLWFVPCLVIHVDKRPLHFIVSLYLQNSQL